MISAVFFTWFFAACLWTVNALRRPVPPHRGFPPLWLPGMIVSELAPLFLVARLLVAGLFVAAGALDRPVGVAGLALLALSEIGALVLIVRTIRGASATGHSPSPLTLFQVVEGAPGGIEHRVEVPYWDELTLDIYAPDGPRAGPALVYVHPGSWMRGRPGRQARSLFHRMVSRGWVVLDIRYPLSPLATFPDHLVGVQLALAWAKGPSGAALGIDPERVVVSGGSSGAHLAALAALTSGDPSLQPGFAQADTSVAGCLPFYGIYDLFVRNPTRYDWPFIAQHVLKTGRDANPDLYQLGSPIDQVHGAAPPFFVVHGEFDSIVLPAESEHFVAALLDAGVETRYFEVPGAQHGFDAVASLRTRAVAGMCAEWLDEVVDSGED